MRKTLVVRSFSSTQPTIGRLIGSRQIFRHPSTLVRSLLERLFERCGTRTAAAAESDATRVIYSVRESCRGYGCRVGNLEHGSGR